MTPRKNLDDANVESRSLVHVNCAPQPTIVSYARVSRLFVACPGPARLCQATEMHSTCTRGALRNTFTKAPEVTLRPNDSCACVAHAAPRTNCFLSREAPLHPSPPRTHPEMVLARSTGTTCHKQVTTEKILIKPHLTRG